MYKCHRCHDVPHSSENRYNRVEVIVLVQEAAVQQREPFVYDEEPPNVEFWLIRVRRGMKQ
jgi:hypothetical protein